MSLHFYPINEDIQKEKSINDFQDIFVQYTYRIPSLKEALTQMFLSTCISDQKAYELTEDIIKKSEKIVKFNFDLIKEKYSMLTEEDAKIISSYNCETEDSNYSPYKILNNNLCQEDREKGIKNISKYLYIFLKSLRKLNRYYPKQKYMYRCINKKVYLKENYFNKKIIPYSKGNTKIFYGFTSITSGSYF